MKVVVFGATGGVGRSVIEQAVAAGHEVTAFVRDAAKLPAADRVRVVVGDALDGTQTAAAVAGADAVIVALASAHGLKKSDELERMAAGIAAGVREHGVPRILVCASAGVEDELTGPIGASVAFVLRHPLRDHRAAIAQYRASGAAVTVARPMGLTDDALRTDYTRTEAGAPKGRTIPRASVAHFLVDALTDPTTVGASVGLSA